MKELEALNKMLDAVFSYGPSREKKKSPKPKKKRRRRKLNSKSRKESQ